jgi:Ulp1 family protease
MVSPPGLVGHFFVACFDFSVHHPDFFVDISFYDSLERAQKRIKQASTCASMVKKVNLFFNKYILHERKYRSIQQSDADLLRRVQYKDSPLQNNGCDCGIFAVATTLHLAEQIPLTSHSFLQTHVTKARSELAKTLCSKSAGMERAIF